MQLYEYTICNGICSFPKEFGEAIAFATLGTVQSKISSGEIAELSFANTYWMDVAALLFLGVIVGNTSHELSITIDLGEYKKRANNPHAAFVVYFVNEGFLDAFASTGKVIFKFNGKVEYDIQIIKNSVVSYASKLKTCFPPTFLPNKTLFSDEQDQPALLKYVENIIANINNSVGFSAYGGTVAKERTLEKIRPVIQELLQNICEHAYPESSVPSLEGEGYFAIFVRMITPEEDNKEHRQERDSRNILVIEPLARDSGFPRLEIYILDAGVSLRTYAMRLASPNKLKDVATSLAKRLFNGDSAKYRKAKNKPEITGLMHVGSVLGHDKDFVRFFTVDGMVGICCEDYGKEELRQPNSFVFRKTCLPRSFPSEMQEVFDKAEYTSPSGTCYCVSIPIYRNTLAFPREWYEPSVEEKKSLYEKIQFRDENSLKGQNNFIFFDRFFKKTKEESIIVDYPNDTVIKEFALYGFSRPTTDTLVIRFPRHVSKNICTRWLDVITNEKFSFGSVIFVDVSPSFALQLFNIVSKEVGIKKRLHIRILTTSWHTASFVSEVSSGKFSTEVENFTASDFYNGDDAKIFQFIPHLIRHDSNFFWQGIDHTLFYSGNVQLKKEVYTEGYLHFKEAVSTDKKRRAICKLALRRILHLVTVEKILPFDPLIESLSHDISLACKDILQKNDKVAALVSVNATADSFTYHENDDITPTYRIACFQAPLKKGKIPLDVLTALDWLPNEKIILPKHDTQIRIGGTSYILPKGIESIEMPHYKIGNDFKKTMYGCLKKDTYRQFSELSCLRFQHTKNGSRHDLLSLNTVRAIKGSRFHLDGPYAWLKDKLRNFNNTDTIIYPSHYANDIILEDALDGEQVPKLLSVSFYSDTGTMPLRLSPSSQDALELSQKSLVAGRVIIFDDGVLTGAHLNFLKDFIHYYLEVPQNQIKTLTIVDRTRTPLYAKIAQVKSENDIRYWRYDVPVFADEHACMFCHAIRLLKELTTQLPFDVQTKIIEDWLPIWEVREMYSEWGASGLAPVTLEKGNPIRKVTFGKKNERKNIIEAYDSTTVLAYITEITQIIPGDLSGGSKGKLVLDEFPEITVELVAGQFFLSFHRLTYADKKQNLKLLFKALLQMLALNKAEDELKPYFSLACLCFLITRKNIFYAFWEENVVPFIQENAQLVWTKSMIAFMSVLYHHGGKKDSFENTKICHENLIAMGVLPKLVTALNDLFAKTAIRFGAHHTTPLTRSVEKLKAIVQSEDHAAFFTCIKDAICDVYDYANRLKVVAPYYPNSASKIREYSEKFYADYNELGKIISDSDKAGDCADISEKCLMRIKSIVAFYESTISEVFEKYIFVLHKERPKSEFLDELVTECCDELKSQGHKIVKSGNPYGNWDTSYYIITPDDIRILLKNIIKNTRNHDEEIYNPNEPSYLENKYAFFWNATIENSGQALFLKMSFKNIAYQEPKPEFSSREIDCLKEFCGHMDFNYDAAVKLFTISITLPLLKA